MELSDISSVCTTDGLPPRIFAPNDNDISFLPASSVTHDHESRTCSGEEEKEEEINERQEAESTPAMWPPQIALPARTPTAKNQVRRDAEDNPTHKFCMRCAEDLPLSSYNANARGIFGCHSYCNMCRCIAPKSEEEEGGDEDEKRKIDEKEENVNPRSLSFAELSQAATAKNQARRDAETDPTHKFCTLCLEDVLLADYTFYAAGMFGRYTHCRACKNSTRRQERAEAKKDEELEDEADDEEDSEEEEEEEILEPRSLTSTERSRLATQWNQERRNALMEGETATKKFCTKCLEDKEHIDFTKKASAMFGRAWQCKGCVNTARRRQSEESEEGEERDEEEDNGEEIEEDEESEEDEYEDKDKDEKNMQSESKKGEEAESENPEPQNCYPHPTATKLPLRIASPSWTATAKNQARRSVDANSKHKFCTLCLKDLPLSSYTNNPRGIFGCQSRCNECINGSERQRRAESKKGEKLKDKEEEEEEKEEEEDGDEEDEREEEEDDEEDTGEKKKGNVDQRNLLSVERSRAATRWNKERRDALAEGQTATKQFCTKCLEDKKHDDFALSNSGVFGRDSRCRVCRKTNMHQRWVEPETDANEEDNEKEGEEKEEVVGYEDLKSLTSEERDNEATRRNRMRDDEDASATSKWCRICLIDRPLEDFDKNSASILGRRSDCQICMTYGGRRARVQPQTAAR
jgi:hypothetical protein